MPTLDIALTSRLLWIAALVTAPVDLVYLSLLVKALPTATWRLLRWPLAAGAAVFFTAIWIWALWGLPWDLGYWKLFPGVWRYVSPPLFGLAHGACALLFWRIAMYAPLHPAVVFCALGGLVSVPGHAWAIYGRGLFEQVPVLREVSPVSAITFGFFEFVFYFAVILSAAILMERFREWWRAGHPALRPA